MNHFFRPIERFRRVHCAKAPFIFFALLAVFGFSIIACPNDSPDGSSRTPEWWEGTYYSSDGESYLVINGSIGTGVIHNEPLTGGDRITDIYIDDGGTVIGTTIDDDELDTVWVYAYADYEELGEAHVWGIIVQYSDGHHRIALGEDAYKKWINDKCWKCYRCDNWDDEDDKCDECDECDECDKDAGYFQDVTFDDEPEGLPNKYHGFTGRK